MIKNSVVLDNFEIIWLFRFLNYFNFSISLNPSLLYKLIINLEKIMFSGLKFIKLISELTILDVTYILNTEKYKSTIILYSVANFKTGHRHKIWIFCPNFYLKYFFQIWKYVFMGKMSRYLSQNQNKQSNF